MLLYGGQSQSSFPISRPWLLDTITMTWLEVVTSYIPPTRSGHMYAHVDGNFLNHLRNDVLLSTVA
jgi:hypothetical protein